MTLATILILIKKEFILELRRKSVVSGLGLYLLSLVFICYLTFNLRQNSISANTWSALFWLTILFSLINSVAKSFIGEKKGVSIYYYSTVSPKSIILAKIIYNSFLSIVIALAGLLLFATFILNPIQDLALFIFSLIVICIGLSTALSFISAIASKANNSNVLMAVLSFPVIISILLMAVRVTKNVIDGIDRSASADELLNLMGIATISGAIGYILFPYVWRS